GAQRGTGDGIGAVDLVQADQHVDREQQRQRGNDGDEDDQRITEVDGENGEAGSHGVGADPGNEAVEPGTHRADYGSRRWRRAPTMWRWIARVQSKSRP